MDPAAPLAFSIHRLPAASSPSPMSEVQAGEVRAVFPNEWRARPLGDDVAQEGFMASPRLDRFERGTGNIQGIEAFWVDVAELRIPSNYYYLAARNEAATGLGSQKSCRLDRRSVLVDRPPDLTGQSFSPSDYVSVATGTCLTSGNPTRWAYVVAAPGYGPMRRTGLPTSGLYVVFAVVSGPNADRLLKEMLAGARFGGTPISEIVAAAGRELR